MMKQLTVWIEDFTKDPQMRPCLIPLLLTGWSSYTCGSPSDQLNSSHTDSVSEKETTCPCGLSNKKQLRIIGGEETSPNQYPFMLVLVLTEGLRHFCGASILSEKHAITAAHCTEPLGDRAISVIAGAHDKTQLTENTMVVPVEKHVEHEYYNPLIIMNDISLLFLAKPLKFGPNISPLCMPTKKMYLDNQDVKIIGWGMTAADKPPSIVLKEVDVKILPYIRCKGMYPFMYNPLPWKVSQICTGAKNKGACRGDSGGPVIYRDPKKNKYVLVGLVSFGAASCDTESPTVETDATYYVPWIESHLKG